MSDNKTCRSHGPQTQKIKYVKAKEANQLSFAIEVASVFVQCIRTKGLLIFPFDYCL